MKMTDALSGYVMGCGDTVYDSSVRATRVADYAVAAGGEWQ